MHTAPLGLFDGNGNRLLEPLRHIKQNRTNSSVNWGRKEHWCRPEFRFTRILLSFQSNIILDKLELFFVVYVVTLLSMIMS